jgi:hypothetical protein
MIYILGGCYSLNLLYFFEIAGSKLSKGHLENSSVKI